jgi:molecular chaperone GrpE
MQDHDRSSDETQDEMIEGTDTQEAEENVPEPSTAASTDDVIAGLKDQLLRQMAETENVRKRAERERDETAKYAVTKLARDLLEIADNLGRAIQAYGATDQSQSPETQTFLEGVKLTEKALMATFERYKIQKIDPKGEAFDHNFHQAMFEVPTSEHAPGTIVEVLQPGYVLHDRLLRPAMVGVAKALA